MRSTADAVIRMTKMRGMAEPDRSPPAPGAGEIEIGPDFDEPLSEFEPYGVRLALD